MNNRLYQGILAGLLVVVLISIYFQFTTFGTGQYWVFVVILLVAWVISRLLLRQKKKGK